MNKSDLFAIWVVLFMILASLNNGNFVSYICIGYSILYAIFYLVELSVEKRKKGKDNE